MASKRLRVGMYVNDPKSNILRFIRCLTAWDMEFQSLWRDELPELKPGQFDVVLLHGGWYGIDRTPTQNQHDVHTSPKLKDQGDALRRFVKAGGGVVGVCAGSFNVVWLGLIEADISRAGGAGMHELEVVKPRHPILKGVVEATPGRKDRTWKRIPAIRFNGPIFFPANPEAMVASYDWERRLGAILAGDYGKGRAVAISPHPERTEHDLGQDVLLEPLMPAAGILRNALIWAAGKRVPGKSS